MARSLALGCLSGLGIGRGSLLVVLQPDSRAWALLRRRTAGHGGCFAELGARDHVGRPTPLASLFAIYLAPGTRQSPSAKQSHRSPDAFARPGNIPHPDSLHRSTFTHARTG